MPLNNTQRLQAKGIQKECFNLSKFHFMKWNGTEENLDKTEQLRKEAAEYKVNEIFQ